MWRVIGRERANRFWPSKSLHDAGTATVYRSDWPSVVPSSSPWPGTQAMVARCDPYGHARGALAPEQSIGLAGALEIFTCNGAAALRMEHDAGGIEVGKLADLMVLSQNLFEIPPGQISDAQVLETVFEGRMVSAKQLS